MSKCNFQHLFCETKPFLPFNHDWTHVLVVLLRVHLSIYFIPESLSLLIFLHFFVIKLFSSLHLSSHIFASLTYFFFSSLEVLYEGFPLDTHFLNSFLLLLNCPNVITIEFSVCFNLQKLIGSVNFNKFFSCLLLLVTIRMVFQGK